MRLYSNLLLLAAILILTHPMACNEIAYAIGPNGESPVGQANITEYNGTAVVSFTVSDSPLGLSGSYKAQRTVDSIKDEINKKVNRGNELVRDEGLDLVGNKSGARRIDQFCSIYDYMVGNWTFVSDWTGLDEFQYSNYTLKKGSEVGSSGKGDCDDFSILLASLFESIGGTPRIIFAYGPGGGHAYVEVYLGKSDDKNLDKMMRWLRSEYKVEDINIHKDAESNDIWLNMDWWKGPSGAECPGGPFYPEETHVPVYPQEYMPEKPLTPVENLPPVSLFSHNPIQPEVEEVVSFSATQSKDPDGKIVYYEWDFGDGETASGITKSECRHVYSSKGPFRVKLTVTDNAGDINCMDEEINVTETLPQVIFAYSPTYPIIGDLVTFNASLSKDKEEEIKNYEWELGDGSKKITTADEKIEHNYLNVGKYIINLTANYNNNSKSKSFSQEIEVRELNKPGDDWELIYNLNADNLEVVISNSRGEKGDYSFIQGRIFALDPENGIYQFEGNPPFWRRIGGPSKMIVAGQILYNLSNDGSVWAYYPDRNVWKIMGDDPSTSHIYAGGSRLFATNYISIFEYNMTLQKWEVIGTSSDKKEFAVTYRGDLFALSIDGEKLLSYDNMPMKWSEWSPSPPHADSIYARYKTDVILYDIEMDKIYQYNIIQNFEGSAVPFMPEWTLISPISDLPMNKLAVGQGSLFGLSSNGTILQYVWGGNVPFQMKGTLQIYWNILGRNASEIYAGGDDLLVAKDNKMKMLWLYKRK